MCTLYLRITVNGERVEPGSTGIKIFADTWLEHGQRVSSKDHHANFKNEQLALHETLILAIFNELLRKNQGITADRVKRPYIRAETVTYLTALGNVPKRV